MAERIFQVKTEMESTEDFIKVEHMDYILGTSTSEDKLSESNNAVHDPLKPDITEHDFSQESFISEHISLKVESEDTTFTEVSDINNCDNSKIGAHLQPVVVLKSQEFLKSSWLEFKKFLKKEQSKLKNQSIPSVASSNCVFIEDGLSINDHDIIKYLEFCCRSCKGHKSESKVVQDLKSTINEAYSLFQGRDFATDFPQASKHVPHQQQPFLSNNTQVYSDADLLRTWVVFTKHVKKKSNFTEIDFVNYFTYMDEKRTVQYTYWCSRRGIQVGKSKFTKRKIHQTYNKIKCYYSKTFDCDFEERFPKLYDKVKHCFPYKQFKPNSQKNIEMKNEWNNFVTFIGKTSDFANQDFVDYIFFLQGEKKNSKRELFNKFYNLREYYNTTLNNNFDQDFQELFRQIKPCIVHPMILFQIAKFDDGPSNGRILNSWKRVDKYYSTALTREHNTLWTKFCRFHMKGSEFTENEIFAFLVNLHKTLSPVYAKEMARRLVQVYFKKMNRDIYEDFDGIPNFLARMDVEESRNIEMERFNDYKGDMWQRFCEFTGKCAQFTEGDIKSYFSRFVLKTFDSKELAEFTQEFVEKYE